MIPNIIINYVYIDKLPEIVDECLLNSLSNNVIQGERLSNCFNFFYIFINFYKLI